MQLSTPHGTLGTFANRNSMFANLYNELSTPHGTLGTLQLQKFLENLETSFNSTRYIRNTFYLKFYSFNTFLSTPHGTLGTEVSKTVKEVCK